MSTRRPTIWIFERGIDGFASIWGDWKNWPNQSIAWINEFAAEHGLDWWSQTLTYFSTPLTAGASREHRAAQFARLLRAYSVRDWQIVLVAHSEGAATVLRALPLAGWPNIQSVHLVCGACDSNFNTNNLNWAIRNSKVGRVVCYVSGMDTAMELENTWLGKMAFFLNMKNAPLGLDGPTNVGFGLMGSRVIVEKWPSYGHSDCWNEGGNFESTMLQLVRNSGLGVGQIS
jgi:predicted alpha/beta hydrolase family esterase